MRLLHAQGLGRIRAVACDHKAPMFHCRATDLKRPGGVGQIERSVGCQPIGQSHCAGIECCDRLRRQQQELRHTRRRRRPELRCFFDDDVRVGAADSQRADTGTPWVRPRCPRLERRVHVERARLELASRVGLLEVQRRRKLPMLHGERYLDEAGNAGSRVGVSDVGLDRSDAAEADLVCSLTKSLRQRGNFNRVAHRRASAVGFDVADRFWRNVGNRQRLGNRLRLAVDTGREVTDFHGPIVVDRRPLDDRVNVVTIGQRIGEPAQNHDTHPAAKHRALRRRVEGMAMPVRRQNLAFPVNITVAMRQLDRHTTGQRHVALSREQALHAHVDRHERGGTGRLHVHTRPFQIEQVRDPRGQKVLVVARVAHQEKTHRRHQLRIRQQVERHVGVVPGTTKNSDRTGETVGHVASVFERLPCALDEVAVLRIHHRHFARRKTEETGVEHFHLGKHCPRFHVTRVHELRRLDAGCEQLLVGEGLNRLNAVAQVDPVFTDVASARKAPRHSDHGNVGVKVVV